MLKRCIKHLFIFEIVDLIYIIIFSQFLNTFYIIIYHKAQKVHNQSIRLFK